MKKIAGKGLCLLLAAVLWLVGCTGCAANDAGTVNGVRVSREELRFYMHRLMDDVMATAETDFGLDGTAEDFWYQPMGDTTPLEELRSAAMEEIVRVKVMQLEAQARGIESPLTYKEQQSLWKEDNDNRLKQEKAGELIYGTTLRSFYTYLSLVLSEVETQLRESLQEEGTIRVTESEMQAYYAAHPDWFAEEDDTFENSRGNIELWILKDKYEAFLSERVEKAEIVYGNMTVEPEELE